MLIFSKSEVHSMDSKKSPVIICRVTRPDLTPEERAERMAAIKQAATELLVATMRRAAV
jgi:hypothetical protein